LQNTGIKFLHTSAQSQDCRNGDPALFTKTLSPACILLQIKLTDVLASSAYLNPQEFNGILRQNTAPSLPSAL
jgi:hypothetical protein